MSRGVCSASKPEIAIVSNARVGTKAKSTCPCCTMRVTVRSEVGVHGIAGNAIRWVRARRKVGNVNCGRGAMDVYHPRAQAACGFALVSLDSDHVDAGDSTAGSWREWLAEDNKVTPADEAAFRLDFEGWHAGGRRGRGFNEEGEEGEEVSDEEQRRI